MINEDVAGSSTKEVLIVNGMREGTQVELSVDGREQKSSISGFFSGGGGKDGEVIIQMNESGGEVRIPFTETKERIRIVKFQ